MPSFNNANLIIKFQREYFRNIPDIPNPSGAIPVATLGYVLAAVSDLMRSTWDYANTGKDERFESIRKIAQSIQRNDIELVVLETRPGSLEISLDWLMPLAKSAVVGMLSNALWDLTKYSFSSIQRLIAKQSDNCESSPDDDDPLLNRILPDVLNLARNGYQEFANSSVNTSFFYRDLEKEFSFTIDRKAQESLLKANQVETKIITRMAGSIEGINWRKKNITVRWELFPDDETICDIDGMDLDELNHLLTPSLQKSPQRLGFDVELAWRKGVANLFPPDAIRIIKIMPANELLLHSNYSSSYRGLKRPSISDFNHQIELSKEELRFLKWFAWADSKWDSPNIHGVVGYLTQREGVLGHSASKKEIQDMIQSLVKHGLILKTRVFTKRGAETQALRLNRNHPYLVANPSLLQ
jgi:hypothetical protein